MVSIAIVHQPVHIDPAFSGQWSTPAAGDYSTNRRHNTPPNVPKKANNANTKAKIPNNELPLLPESPPGPVRPREPVWPGTPAGPAAPAEPGGPPTPGGPEGPCTPWDPCGPEGPASPFSPTTKTGVAVAAGGGGGTGVGWVGVAVKLSSVAKPSTQRAVCLAGMPPIMKVTVLPKKLPVFGSTIIV